MAKIGTVQEVAVKDLIPYERNARTHDDEQVDLIAKSIEEFGFLNPILIDKGRNVIAGHGRIMAARKIGLEKVPAVYVEGLTEEQRRAYILADNRLTEMGGWDMDTVNLELAELQNLDFDISLTGFQMPDNLDEWFSTRDRNDRSRQEGNDEYNEFLDKFEQPKTTDDCYTPDNVYEVVANYAERISGISKDKFLRPFFPGGDYATANYPAGCAVVDNPPFSILAEIVDFYKDRKIPFFLFAPGLSVFGYSKRDGVTAISTYAQVTYENGANVTTSFVTNMIGDDVAAMTAPDLSAAIDEVNEENEKRVRKTIPKYTFPMEVITAARLGYLSKYGQDVKVIRSRACFIRTLDAMEEAGASGIYGCAYLLSEKAAAEKAAAEKAREGVIDAVWELSERELGIVHTLGGDDV